MNINLMKTVLIAATAVGAFLMVSAAAGAEQESWIEQLDFRGDFRLRYEYIDEQAEAGRERMRFRGRFGFATGIGDDVKFVMRLATGHGNPVSTNQSFENGFSLDDIRLNLAFVDWKIADEMNVYVGKMNNPLFRAGGVPLIWDSDFTPEGLALRVGSGMLFGTLGGFLIEKRSGVDDSLLYALQGGLRLPLGENNKLTIGAGYFAFTNTIGNKPFYKDRPKGNTVDVDGHYVYEYKDVEVFAQFDGKVAGWPLQLFAHYARNTAVPVQDTAFAFGARLGSASKKGQLQFRWMYLDTEADAVIGTFTDSDFGSGSTDSLGHMLVAKYGISDKLFVGGTLFINKVDRFQGAEHDYNRVQIDLEVKFN